MHCVMRILFWRELTEITENFHQTWFEHIKTLLIEIKRSVQHAGGMLTQPELEAFKNRYDQIISLGAEKNPFDIHTLTKIKKTRTQKAR